MDERKELLEEFAQKFLDLGKFLDFSKYEIKTECQSSSIYLLKDSNNKYSLQLEIEWRECDCFLYLVRLENGKIPKEFFYAYKNGEWCRKYIEDIYSKKNSVYIEKSSMRYTKEFLECKFEFYAHLIQNNPKPIRKIIEE